jgi:hypothetical protein
LRKLVAALFFLRGFLGQISLALFELIVWLGQVISFGRLDCGARRMACSRLL